MLSVKAGPIVKSNLVRTYDNQSRSRLTRKNIGTYSTAIRLCPMHHIVTAMRIDAHVRIDAYDGKAHD